MKSRAIAVRKIRLMRLLRRAGAVSDRTTAVHSAPAQNRNSITTGVSLRRVLIPTWPGVITNKPSATTMAKTRQAWMPLVLHAKKAAPAGATFVFVRAVRPAPTYLMRGSVLNWW